MSVEFNLRSLSSKFIPYDSLSIDWRTYKKDPERYIHRFIAINRQAWKFLQVEATYIVENHMPGLLISSSQYVGAVPLLSPITGKPSCELTVTPIYGENLGSLITLLDERIEVEFSDQKLVRPLAFKLPIYFSCIEYMKAFREAIKCNWTKFESQTAIENSPTSTTDWDRYARESYSPNMRLVFANELNKHTSYHSGWLELTGLLKTVLEVYSASLPPNLVRSKYHRLVSFLEAYVRHHPTKRLSSFPKELSSDPPAIKALKASAIRFLSQQNVDAKAWRIEISKLFERFVQYVFERAADYGGWQSHSNIHFPIINQGGIRWAIRYLEPDLILTRLNQQWIIDAKYKSHFFNFSARESQALKSSFREDFHQIVAYTSFISNYPRHSMLVYPSPYLSTKILRVTSPLSSIEVEMIMLGLPFTTDKIQENIKSIEAILNCRLGEAAPIR